MSARPLTPQERLAALRHLANGKPTYLVAQILHTTRDQVTAQLAWAADQIAAQLDDAERATIRPGSIVPRHAEPRRVAAHHPTPAPAPAPAPAAPAPPPADPLRTLIDTGQAHPSKRVQQATTRLLADADKLREQIHAEDTRAREKAAQQRRREQQRARAKAARARLHAQELEQRKAERAAAAAAAAAEDARQRAAAPATAVRAWAASQGIPIGDRGRISRELRQQYLNHNQQQEETA